MNCPADVVGGALGSILGLAHLVSIAVNTVALVIIWYLKKVKQWVAEQPQQQKNNNENSRD